MLLFEGIEPQKLNNNSRVKTKKFPKLKLVKTIVTRSYYYVKNKWEET